MIAALIFVVSIAALTQFFVSYARSIIASSRKVGLSEQVREVTGLASHAVAGDEFRRFLQLVQLCPAPGDDQMEIRTVRLYFGLLDLLRAIGLSALPRLRAWVKREREGCTYFAAVALDHRIAFNRDLMARQAANRF